ncbi:3-hydroxyacyl-CoA dehydrogenase family protein, partial [bacterium]|nr:3-hydroxyacyl-CoA dehydrogenase family protein [bacterium]
ETIKKITVVGTGVMGPDISLGFAMAGYEVTGLDIEQAILGRAAQKIASNCRQMVEEGMITEDEAVKIQSRITLTLDWDGAVAGADYITEAVPEEMETKKEVFKRCGEICSEEVVVASNTSSMSITEIASEIRYPQRAISTHWTIPAHLSPMVEVICGEKTSTATKDFVLTLLKQVGKTPVACKNSPGFIHNYVQFAMVKAALNLLERQIATPEDIDTVIRNGFGLRLSSVGPIQFVDMCGLDTILNIQKYMYDMTKDSMYKPSRIVEESVERGDLGVKTGKGFYDYSEDDAEKLRERTNRTILKIRQVLKKT